MYIALIYVFLILLGIVLQKICPIEMRWIIGVYNWLVFIPIWFFLFYNSVVVLVNNVLKDERVFLIDNLWALFPILHLIYFMVHLF